MGEPLDELYFQWLYKQVADPEFEDKDALYWTLLRILFSREVVWYIGNDENHIQDGKELRFRFLEEAEIAVSDVDDDWLELPCSFLELAVGLARRVAFDAGGQPHYWFWEMMDNIGLRGFTDRRRFTRSQLERINHILDDVIHRTYEPSGLGGFFPLQYPQQDQTKIQILYQYSAYILERGLAG